MPLLIRAIASTPKVTQLILPRLVVGNSGSIWLQRADSHLVMLIPIGDRAHEPVGHIEPVIDARMLKPFIGTIYLESLQN